MLETSEEIEAFYAAQSDAAKLVYAQRLDRAQAVYSSVSMIWERKQSAQTTTERIPKSRARIVEYALLVVGALLHWWLVPEVGWSFTFGSTLMLFAGLSWAAANLDLLLARRQIDRLAIVENDFLYRWCAAGGGDGSFWTLRNLWRDEWALDENAKGSFDPQYESQQKKRAEIGRSRSEAWLRARAAILVASSVREYSWDRWSSA